MMIYIAYFSLIKRILCINILAECVILLVGNQASMCACSHVFWLTLEYVGNVSSMWAVSVKESVEKRASRLACARAHVCI